MMRLFIVTILAASLVDFSYCMTRVQLNKAGKVMKNVCAPKNNLTPEQVQNINKGDFQDDNNIKCYIGCVLQMAQMVKGGKFSSESSKKQIDNMFPDDMKEPAKKAIDSCKSVVDENKDKEFCEASFTILHCIYKADPDNFVFP